MILRIKVTPGSSKFNLALKEDDKGAYLKINATKQPEKGKVNIEILKELKTLFGEVKIISGHKSREKYIKIEHNTKELEKIIESRKND